MEQGKEKTKKKTPKKGRMGEQEMRGGTSEKSFNDLISDPGRV